MKIKNGRVETNIYYRSKCPGSPYWVSVNVNGAKYHRSFATLIQARHFRDEHKKPLKCQLCGGDISQGYLCTSCNDGGHGPAAYDTFKNMLIGEDIKRDSKGFLLVKCYKCKEWFNPTYSEANSRAHTINGDTRGQSNLYCSQHCKDTCDVYHQHTQFKHQIPIARQARCNQRVNRQALLDAQQDQYGYTYCEKCGIRTSELAIHHNVMISKDHTVSDDMSHQILVCNKCHTHERC